MSDSAGGILVSQTNGSFVTINGPAAGLGSAVSGMIGGLPMIAEIVRSTASVANGARTRWSNFFHGVFILVFVSICAALINYIPMASLAALLAFTRYRPASPRVFKEAYEIGCRQLTTAPVDTTKKGASHRVCPA